MATYYISTTGNDGNVGSEASPWRTLTKGAATAIAGDTVIIKDGTYVQGSVNFPNSGSAGGRITFMAENKWGAIVSSTSGCNPGLSINGSYVTIRDLHIQLDATNVTCASYTSANADIRAWNTINATPGNPTTGLVGFEADGLKITSTQPARAVAIKSNQDFSDIHSCDTTNMLEVLNTKDCFIRHNVVRGQDPFGFSVLVKGGARSCQIYNNEIRNAFTAGYGICLGGDSCAACTFDTGTNVEAYECVAFNNVVVNDVTGSFCNAIIFQGAEDCAFYNNVLVGARLISWASGSNGVPTNNPDVRNNIFIAQSAAGSPWSGTFGFTYTGTFTCNYNNFFNFSSQPAQANAITGNPLLANQMSNWSLSAGSPCRDAGQTLTFTGFSGEAIDVAFDFIGATRTEPWDLGIYNYAAESSTSTATATVWLSRSFRRVFG